LFEWCLFAGHNAPGLSAIFSGGNGTTTTEKNLKFYCNMGGAGGARWLFGSLLVFSSVLSIYLKCQHVHFPTGAFFLSEKIAQHPTAI
jgi:hypothetical protein